MRAAGTRNIVLTGKGRRYHVPNYSGPISLKSVRIGSARWVTPHAGYTLFPDCVLILNDRQDYALTIDSAEVTQTFCPVFRTGLVENAGRCLSEPAGRLLDDPFRHDPIGFPERIESRFGYVGAALDRLVAAVDRGAGGIELDWRFERLAAVVARSVSERRLEPQRLTSVREATRREIYRRLSRARRVIEEQLSRPWLLRDMAGEAPMAPHHFHRCFVQAYGITPARFIAQRRLERAAGLLGSGRASVTETCLEIGYSSLSSFSIAFRQRFGMSPLEYGRRSKGSALPIAPVGVPAVLPSSPLGS
jgi:AraC-like DNA-binding protein